MVARRGSSTARARRVGATSALLGALAWLALVLSGPHEAVTRWRIERWVLLAVLVYVPAVLWFVGREPLSGWVGRTYRAGVWLQPLGAACVVASAFVASTPLRGALAVAWMVVTGVLATFGLLRLRAHAATPLSALLVDAAFAYAVVGAVALVLSRLGVTLVFRPTIIHLTAIHYHYAGFVLPVVAGLTGRFVERNYPDGGVRRQTFRATGAIVLAGMVLIAVGITASPLVEVVSVVFFTVAVAAFAVLSLSFVPRIVRDAADTGRAVVASTLLAVASASVVVTMAFAVGYGWSASTGETVVSLSTMVAWHGTVNALGFAGAGLGAWFLLAPESRAERVTATFSPLHAVWRVGADYPERTGVASGDDPPGQLDALDDLAAPGFDAGDVDPAVTRFYERTGEYALSYDAEWHAPFRTVARLASPVTASVEQLNLPGPGEDGPHQTDGRIVGIDAGADPREDARFWVRTHANDDPSDAERTRASDASVFVAAYALHDPDDDTERAYVNVGLPLPLSNLTAILAPSTLDAGDDRVGFALTSLGPDDEGLYLSTAAGPVGVPMHERFRVWPADAPDAPSGHVDLAPDGAARTDGAPDDDVLVATHEMWTLGVQFLTIRYVVYPDGTA